MKKRYFRYITIGLLGAVSIAAPIISVCSLSSRNNALDLAKAKLMFEKYKVTRTHYGETNFIANGQILSNADVQRINEDVLDNVQYGSILSSSSDISKNLINPTVGELSPTWYLQASINDTKTISLYRANNDQIVKESSTALSSFADAGQPDIYFFNNIFFESKSDLQRYLKTIYFEDTANQTISTLRIKGPNGEYSNAINMTAKSDWKSQAVNFVLENASKVIRVSSVNGEDKFIEASRLSEHQDSITYDDIPYIHVRTNNGQKTYVVGLNSADEYELSGPTFYTGYTNVANGFGLKSNWTKQETGFVPTYQDTSIVATNKIINEFFKRFFDPEEPQYISGMQSVSRTTLFSSVTSGKSVVDLFDYAQFDTSSLNDTSVDVPISENEEENITVDLASIMPERKVVVDTQIDSLNRILDNAFNNTYSSYSWILAEAIAAAENYETNKDFNFLIKLPMLYTFMMDRLISAGAPNELVTITRQYFSQIADIMTNLVLINLGPAAMMPASNRPGLRRLDFKEIYGLNSQELSFELEKYDAYFAENYPSLATSAKLSLSQILVQSAGITYEYDDIVTEAENITETLYNVNGYQVFDHSVINNIIANTVSSTQHMIENSLNVLDSPQAYEIANASFAGYSAFLMTAVQNQTYTTNRDMILDLVQSEAVELITNLDSWENVPNDNRFKLWAYVMQETGNRQTFTPGEVLSSVNPFDVDSLLEWNLAFMEIEDKLLTDNSYNAIADVVAEKGLYIAKDDPSNDRINSYISTVSETIVSTAQKYINSLIDASETYTPYTRIFSGMYQTFDEFTTITIMRMLGDLAKENTLFTYNEDKETLMINDEYKTAATLLVKEIVNDEANDMFMMEISHLYRGFQAIQQRIENEFFQHEFVDSNESFSLEPQTIKLIMQNTAQYASIMNQNMDLLKDKLNSIGIETKTGTIIAYSGTVTSYYNNAPTIKTNIESLKWLKPENKIFASDAPVVMDHATLIPYVNTSSSTNVIPNMAFSDKIDEYNIESTVYLIPVNLIQNPFEDLNIYEYSLDKFIDVNYADELGIDTYVRGIVTPYFDPSLRFFSESDTLNHDSTITCLPKWGFAQNKTLSQSRVKTAALSPMSASDEPDGLIASKHEVNNQETSENKKVVIDNNGSAVEHSNIETSNLGVAQPVKNQLEIQESKKIDTLKSDILSGDLVLDEVDSSRYSKLGKDFYAPTKGGNAYVSFGNDVAFIDNTNNQVIMNYPLFSQNADISPESGFSKESSIALKYDIQQKKVIEFKINDKSEQSFAQNKQWINVENDQGVLNNYLKRYYPDNAESVFANKSNRGEFFKLGYTQEKGLSDINKSKVVRKNIDNILSKHKKFAKGTDQQLPTQLKELNKDGKAKKERKKFKNIKDNFKSKVLKFKNKNKLSISSDKFVAKGLNEIKNINNAIVLNKAIESGSRTRAMSPQTVAAVANAGTKNDRIALNYEDLNKLKDDFNKWTKETAILETNNWALVSDFLITKYMNYDLISVKEMCLEYDGLVERIKIDDLDAKDEMNVFLKKASQMWSAIKNDDSLWVNPSGKLLMNSLRGHSFFLEMDSMYKNGWDESTISYSENFGQGAWDSLINQKIDSRKELCKNDYKNVLIDSMFTSFGDFDNMSKNSSDSLARLLSSLNYGSVSDMFDNQLINKHYELWATEFTNGKADNWRDNVFMTDSNNFARTYSTVAKTDFESSIMCNAMFDASFTDATAKAIVYDRTLPTYTAANNLLDKRLQQINDILRNANLTPEQTEILKRYKTFTKQNKASLTLAFVGENNDDIKSITSIDESVNQKIDSESEKVLSDIKTAKQNLDNTIPKMADDRIKYEANGVLSVIAEQAQVDELRTKNDNNNITAADNDADNKLAKEERKKKNKVKEWFDNKSKEEKSGWKASWKWSMNVAGHILNIVDGVVTLVDIAGMICQLYHMFVWKEYQSVYTFKTADAEWTWSGGLYGKNTFSSEEIRTSNDMKTNDPILIAGSHATDFYYLDGKIYTNKTTMREDYINNIANIANASDVYYTFDEQDSNRKVAFSDVDDLAEYVIDDLSTHQEESLFAADAVKSVSDGYGGDWSALNAESAKDAATNQILNKIRPVNYFIKPELDSNGFLLSRRNANFLPGNSYNSQTNKIITEAQKCEQDPTFDTASWFLINNDANLETNSHLTLQAANELSLTKLNNDWNKIYENSVKSINTYENELQTNMHFSDLVNSAELGVKKYDVVIYTTDRGQQKYFVDTYEIVNGETVIKNTAFENLMQYIYSEKGITQIDSAKIVDSWYEYDGRYFATIEELATYVGM